MMINSSDGRIVGALADRWRGKIDKMHSTPSLNKQETSDEVTGLEAEASCISPDTKVELNQ